MCFILHKGIKIVITDKSLSGGCEVGMKSIDSVICRAWIHPFIGMGKHC